MTRSGEPDGTRPEPGAFELGCDGPTAIVVGVDGSDTGWRAFSYALGQARRQGSRVVCVLAENPAVATLAGAGAMAVPLLDDSAAEIREEIRAEVVGHGAEHGVPVTLVVGTGDPTLVLMQVADAQRADAIVVGASTRIATRLFGSVAVRAVRAGRWPVTVVP